MTDKLFKIDITTPDEHIYSGDAYIAILPSEAGEMGILESHSSVISSLKNGLVKIANKKIDSYSDANYDELIYVSKGIVEVSDNVCSILTNFAANTKKANPEFVREAINALKAKIRVVEDSIELDVLNEEIDLYSDLLSYLDK